MVQWCRSVASALAHLGTAHVQGICCFGLFIVHLRLIVHVAFIVVMLILVLDLHIIHVLIHGGTVDISIAVFIPSIFPRIVSLHRIALVGVKWLAVLVRSILIEILRRRHLHVWVILVIVRWIGIIGILVHKLIRVWRVGLESRVKAVLKIVGVVGVLIIHRKSLIAHLMVTLILPDLRLIHFRWSHALGNS